MRIVEETCGEVRILRLSGEFDAADVPAVITHRGALGVPVMFDVFPTRIVMKHEAGSRYLSAVFRVAGDRMLGALRGHDTLIALSRER